jgi:tRNA(fMet)-specific endonuclease VapC
VNQGIDISTTRICEAELRVGLHLRGNPPAERQQTEDLLATMVMLDLDSSSAEQFGKIRAHLMRVGRPVGDCDTFIAAIAVAHGHSIVTRNPRHYEDVTGLVVETY